MPEPNTTAATGCLLIIIAIITGIAIPLSIITFQILMIIDCSKKQTKNKELWLIIIILGSIIGALTYLLVIKNKRISPPPIKKNVEKPYF
jgi:ABC-type Fe3+-siderophore transport system permease subunit